VTAGQWLRRVGFYVLIVLIAASWHCRFCGCVSPRSTGPDAATSLPSWTLHNFATLAQNPYALRSLGNSVLLAAATMVLVTGPRRGGRGTRCPGVRIPGR